MRTHRESGAPELNRLATTSDGGGWPRLAVVCLCLGLLIAGLTTYWLFRTFIIPLLSSQKVGLGASELAIILSLAFARRALTSPSALTEFVALLRSLCGMDHSQAGVPAQEFDHDIAELAEGNVSPFIEAESAWSWLDSLGDGLDF